MSPNHQIWYVDRRALPYSAWAKDICYVQKLNTKGTTGWRGILWCILNLLQLQHFEGIQIKMIE